MSKELKEYVNDRIFVEKMNTAFADLRADYELDLDTSKEKVSELKSVHVDYKSNLENLISYSMKSSGLLSGLRGTGKSHLMFLARNEINSNIESKKSFCIYLNVKRLHLPSDFDQESFNRVFSIFLYNEINKQLLSLINELTSGTLFDKFLKLFDNEKNDLVKGVGNVFILLHSFIDAACVGSTQIENLDKSEFSRETIEKEAREVRANFLAKITSSGLNISEKLLLKFSDEFLEKNNTKSKSLKYLSIETVRENLKEIVKHLKLKCITFYIDEWEKLYNIGNSQEFLSFYIDKINDNPFFFWIGAVPHRGKFYCLDIGADLQHKIDLDSSLIFENSEDDKRMCMDYFKKFIDNRLKHHLSSYDVSYNILFNKHSKLEMLVFGSMANPRDFGTMVLQCWTNYKDYRSSEKKAGRPFKYINEKMIQDSIKSDGNKKLTNIKNDGELMSVWQDIESFALSKKSSHIAIIDSSENIELLSSGYFSELLYHRLLHYRKGHLSQKDTENEEKVGIYALNFACTFDYHQKDKRMLFITNYDEIHNKVRRYIYDPSKIVKKNENKIWRDSSLYIL